MKILYVLEHFHPYIGGAEHLFFSLTRKMVSQGHEVQVVTTRHDPALPVQEVIEGVEVYRVSCFNRFLFTVFSLPQIIRLAKKTDLIHTTTYNAALPAWLAGKFCGKKVMITFHELWGRLWWQLPFASWLQKIAFYSYEQLILRLPFDQYIAVSAFTQQALMDAKISSHKIVQIYNGLLQEDFANYQWQPPQRFTYTFFGRLGISKGLDLLLPAAATFSKLHPESTLQLIIPKQPKALFQRIVKMIAALQLENHVALYHQLSREELFDKITRSSCVVVPSYSEGFCFVAAESVALGVPVISSQRGALAEVVTGQYLPIDTFDTPGVVNALLKAKTGQWTEKPLRFFSFEVAIKDYLQLYSK